MHCHCIHSCIGPDLTISLFYFRVFSICNCFFVNFASVLLWLLVTEVSARAGDGPAGECVQFKHCQLLKLVNECTHSFRTVDNPLAHLVVTHVMYFETALNLYCLSSLFYTSLSTVQLSIKTLF